MKSEIETLLLCGRCRFSATEAAVLRALLAAPLDWRFILNEASRHGVLGLIFASLNRLDSLALLPEAPREALKSAVRANMSRNLGLTTELIQILKALEQAGIPAIPCKGPVVAVAAYGDVSFRSFCDLDILVREQHLPRAREVLSARGYRSRIPFHPQQERAYMKNECALQMRDEGRGFIVELHWRFTERNASVALPVDSFWDRASSLRLAGTTVATLCPEDLVLYLCVHGAKHRWERLEWITCLSEILRMNPDLDWGALFQRSAQCRIVRLVDLGLNLAHCLLDTQLPPAIEERLRRDPHVLSLTQSIRAGLFSAPEDTPHYQQRATRYLFMLQSREHWFDRFRILLFSAIRPPHPQASEWINLPPRLAFLHHVFRPVRLLSEYSLVAWRHYLR